MPEMPAFLANVLEPRFARAATVAAVHDLSPMVRRVWFEGLALREVSFAPGNEVEFRVSDRAFRHYTPSTFDARAGRFDVVFHLHGGGPGSAWAARLSRGQRVGVLGPAGRFGLLPATRHVLLGDETTLGLFACLSEAAPGRCLGAIEVQRGEESVASAVGLDLPAVAREATRGDALITWLERAAPSPRADVTFSLAGHGETIVRLRAWLLGHGFSRAQIRTKTYWADGKRGL